MPLPTIQQLNNVELDANHIAEIANSTKNTAVDRMGNVKLTIKGVIDKLQSFNPTGPFVTGKAYAFKDEYTYNGVSYVVAVAHVSTTVSADLAANKVAIFQGITNTDLELPTAAGLIGTISGISVQTQFNRNIGNLGRYTISDLPNLMHIIMNYDYKLRPEVVIESYGSSVFNGAGLLSPLDAPVYVFLAMLKKWFDPSDRINFVVRNRAIDGSTVSTFLGAWEATRVLYPTPPAIALTGYNMNDCSPAQWNGGQTFPGFQRALVQAAQVLKKAGVDAVFTTSPAPARVTYPNYSMPDSIAQAWPPSAAHAAPVSPEQLSPPASQSLNTADMLNEGTVISIDFRMMACNDATKAIAGEAGFPVIDSGSYWIRAINDQTVRLGSVALAEGVFYNFPEQVHPNPLGQKVSYNDAFSDFWQSVATSTGQIAKIGASFGYVTFNPDNNAGGISYINDGVIDVNIPYLDGRDSTTDSTKNRSKKPLHIKTRTGAKDSNQVRTQETAFWIDPQTSEAVIGANEWRRGRTLTPDRLLVDNVYDKANAYGLAYLKVLEGNPSTIAGAQFSNRRDFPAGQGGKLTISGRIGGGASRVREYLWTTASDGTLYITETGTAASSATSVFTAVAVGTKVGITTPAASSVTIMWEAL